jgi:quinol monooxygenase YgiN
MVTEFAEIDIKPGMEAQFIAGVEKSLALFAAAAGCHGVALQRSVEAPDHFVLLVKWESVADHMEKFQKSPDFPIWRQNVGDCFAAKPKVWHGEAVVG